MRISLGLRPLLLPLVLLQLWLYAACNTEPAGTGDDDSAAGDDDTDDSDDDDSTGGTPIDSCSDDASEENDDADSAAFLAPGSHPDLIACPGDEDWYEIELDAATELVVQVLFDYEDGDIDAELRDTSGTILSYGWSLSDNELLSAVVEAGTYFVLISQFADDGQTKGTPYSMEVATGFPDCPTDTLEPNNSQADAASLLAGTYTNLQICTGDEDWHAIEVETGQELGLALAFSQDEGDIDLRLRDDAGAILAFSETSTDGESLSYTTGEDGTLYARAFLFEDHGLSAGVIYTLDLSLDSP